MTSFDVDHHGFPVVLADTPKVPRKRAIMEGDQSFAPLPPSTRPTSVDHVEWARRQDAVRDAAREFESLSAQDLRERLRGVTTKPLEDGDLEQFTADVRAAQLDDLVDLLDQTERGKLRGRRTVRVQAPRGYIKKTLGALTDPELVQLESRLRTRGWADRNVKSGLVEKLPQARRDYNTDKPQPIEPDPVANNDRSRL